VRLYRRRPRSSNKKGKQEINGFGKKRLGWFNWMLTPFNLTFRERMGERKLNCFSQSDVEKVSVD
jgi:hypothetical protein